MGLNAKGVNSTYTHVKKPYRESLRQLKDQILDIDEVVVTSPSHLLAIYARFILKRAVILDAGWSLFEGEVISRKSFGFLGFRAARIYCIDLFANHLAKTILVETDLQKKYYKKLFFLPTEKVKVLYTGLDEESFSSLVKPTSYSPPDKSLFSVLFRGKYNLEAGLEVLSEAAEILKNEKIFFSIFAPGIPSHISFSENVKVYTEQLTKAEIAYLLCNADLSLGQLSNNPRLARTIPHKAFESAFCSTPYLTARSSGVMEIFSENELLTFDPGNASDLASQILRTSKISDLRKNKGETMRRKYNETASQDILTQRFLKQIGKEK
jgi:hypothetical protein